MLTKLERLEGSMRALRILERRALEDADEKRRIRYELEAVRDALRELDYMN